MMIDEFYLSSNIICVVISGGRFEDVCGTYMENTSAKQDLCGNLDETDHSAYTGG